MGNEFTNSMLWLSTAGMVDLNKMDAEKKAKRVGQEQQATADAAKLGNLTEEEAALSGSKKAFRQGLFFTSPTGTLGTGSRAKSRLMGG